MDVRRGWRKREGLDGQWRKEVVVVAAVHEIVVPVFVLPFSLKYNLVHTVCGILSEPSE